MHWMHRRRLLILAGICIFSVALITAATFYLNIPFVTDVRQTEQGFQDALRREGRKTPTLPNLVFIGIDQASLDLASLFDADELKANRAFQLMTAHAFPWSREVWAMFMERVLQAGARAVVFDIVFDRPNEGDPAFRQALDRYRERVVIGANFDFSQDDGGNPVAKNVVPNSSLIPPPQMEDNRVGFVIFLGDQFDNKIRTARYTLFPLELDGYPQRSEPQYVSLASRALEKMGLADRVPRDDRPHIIRFSEVNAYPPRALWEIFDDKAWTVNYHNGADLKDKVIVVGPSAQIIHDYANTPMSPATPGPMLHLQAMAAAIENEFLVEEPRWLALAGLGASGLIAFGLIAWIRRPTICLVALVVLSAAYLGSARLLYDHLGILILVVPTLAAFLVSGLFSLGFDYVLERLEKQRTRRTLERYVSKNLVKEILDNPDSYYHSMLGSRKPVTVLFSDLVGFTSLSEKADPVELVKQLNEYLSGMVGHVFENGGTLDKFIGDAIMAVWGNVKSQGVEQDARLAVRAALGMREALHKLNEGWKSEGRMPLGFGVGINHGDAVIGNIGSYEPYERLDPTVIGDSVNLASRLEGLTRTYGVDILLGASVAELVSDEFHLRSVARVQVKGKTLPVDIFTLVGPRNDGANPALLEQLKSYEEGFAQFRDRKFSEAKASFNRFLEAVPGDFLAKMYLEQAIEYEKEPPPADWNAVEVFKKK